MREPILVLLSTAHCSACEQALDLLFGSEALAGRQLRVSDVADDDQLLERYGERVPVLQVRDGETQDALAEVCWPFDQADIDALLERATHP